MTEDDLIASLLPNPIEIMRDGKAIQLWKPTTWQMPENQPPTE
jgi:hypothetical protein